jgi:hypothetical protein
VGFEPTRTFALPVFKTGAINHSTTPPVLRLRHYFGIAMAMGKVDRPLRRACEEEMRLRRQENIAAERSIYLAHSTADYVHVNLVRNGAAQEG